MQIKKFYKPVKTPTLLKVFTWEEEQGGQPKKSYASQQGKTLQLPDPRLFFAIHPF